VLQIKTATSTKHLRSLRVCLKNGNWPAAVLLPGRFVDPFLTARVGVARNGPPCAQPKSLAATHFRFFRQTLTSRELFIFCHYQQCPFHVPLFYPYIDYGGSTTENYGSGRRLWRRRQHFKDLRAVHAEERPIVHDLCSDLLIKSQGIFVPAQGNPLESAATALDAGPGDSLEQCPASA